MKRTKNLISTILLIVMILNLTTVVNAETELTDVKGHWANAYIERLIDTGSVSGYPDGTFRPDETVSKIAFLKMAMVAAYGKDVWGVSEESHWGKNYYVAATQLSIISFDEYDNSEWDEPISRYEMALVASNLAKKALNESSVIANGVNDIMADYNVVSQSEYQSEVIDVYVRGIITGVDAQGTFAGDSNGTRAQAATIIVRIVDDSFRKMPDLGTTVTSGTTIESDDVDYTTVFKEGDTYVANNGNSYVLELDESGVLGVGNGISVWENFTHKNGTDLEHGSIMSDDAHFGQVYLEDSYGEGHSSGEWKDIAQAQVVEANKNVENPQDGDSYGKWLIFNDLFKTWEWTGPSA